MKRIIVLLIVLLSASVLFASTGSDSNPYIPITGNAMRPSSMECTDGLNYILFGNPAAIGEQSFIVQLPYIEPIRFFLDPIPYQFRFQRFQFHQLISERAADEIFQFVRLISGIGAF